MAQNIDPYRDHPTATTLSDTTQFDGVIRFNNSLKINGNYSGKVEANGILVIGPNAKIKGDVTCDEIIVGGEIRGNIFARKRLELLDSAKLYGDIKTSKLKIADGVVFEGKCEMTQSNPNNPPSAQPVQNKA